MRFLIIFREAGQYRHVEADRFTGPTDTYVFLSKEGKIVAMAERDTVIGVFEDPKPEGE